MIQQQDRGTLFEQILDGPVPTGIFLLLIGVALVYWSKKGDDWMYEQGGPGVFTNITWIKNTFGEKAAKKFNIFIAWSIIVSSVFFIAFSLWLHLAD